MIYLPVKKEMESASTIEIRRDNRKKIQIRETADGKIIARISSHEHVLSVITSLVDRGYVVTGDNFYRTATRLYMETFSL